MAATIGSIAIMILAIALIAFRLRSALGLGRRLATVLRSGVATPASGLVVSNVRVERAREPGRYWRLVAALTLRLLLAVVLPLVVAAALVQFVLVTRA